MNLLIPPIVPIARLFLSASGVISTVLAKSAQVFGIWRVGGGEIALTNAPALGGDSSAHDSEDSRARRRSDDETLIEESPNDHHKKE